jgi:hypothetical protein
MYFFKLSLQSQNDWSPELTLLPCVWTHCTEPPEGKLGRNRKYYQGKPLHALAAKEYIFGSAIKYYCNNSQISSADLDLKYQNVTCIAGENGHEGTWSVPRSWDLCTDSKKYSSV